MSHFLIKLTRLGGGAGKAYSIENVLARRGGLRHLDLTRSLRLRLWGYHPGVAFCNDVLAMNYFSENGGTYWTFLRTELHATSSRDVAQLPATKPYFLTTRRP